MGRAFVACRLPCPVYGIARGVDCYVRRAVFPWCDFPYPSLDEGLAENFQIVFIPRCSCLNVMQASGIADSLLVAKL